MTSLYYDNKQGCNYKSMVRDVQDHCKVEKCKFGSFFTNLFTVHMIETFGSATTMANAIKEFETDVEKEYIFEQTLVIGKSAGNLLAYSYNI